MRNSKKVKIPNASYLWIHLEAHPELYAWFPIEYIAKQKKYKQPNFVTAIKKELEYVNEEGKIFPLFSIGIDKTAGGQRRGILNGRESFLNGTELHESMTKLLNLLEEYNVPLNIEEKTKKIVKIIYGQKGEFEDEVGKFGCYKIEGPFDCIYRIFFVNDGITRTVEALSVSLVQCEYINPLTQFYSE